MVTVFFNMRSDDLRTWILSLAQVQALSGSRCFVALRWQAVSWQVRRQPLEHKRTWTMRQLFALDFYSEPTITTKKRTARALRMLRDVMRRVH